MRGSTTIPTFQALHFGLLGGHCLLLWKILLLFFHPACLWPLLSFLHSEFCVSDASVSFSTCQGMICVLRDILSLCWPVLRDTWFPYQHLWTFFFFFFLPQAIPLKRPNQGETGYYWLLAPKFSFSTTGAFLLECRSVEQRPLYKPTVSSGCVNRATARAILVQEPPVSMVAWAPDPRMASLAVLPAAIVWNDHSDWWAELWGSDMCTVPSFHMYVLNSTVSRMHCQVCGGKTNKTKRWKKP